jgi:putative PIN family toxin of toxin-antitoxin system
MTSEPRGRFVLDVNALISAYLFPNSAPGQSLTFVLERHQLLMSLAVAAELTDVLRREKFDRYVNRRRREELLAETIQSSDFIDVSVTVRKCRDPDDDKLLELALAGQATAIVTGDSDLIALHPFQGILILSPHDFLQQFCNARED